MASKTAKSNGNLELELVTDPIETAGLANLRYVSDDEPGIRRRCRGRGFSYVAPDGEVISDPQQRERFQALAIPPAWTDVWICRYENGHIQAIGRDDKGRKQYIYHERWQEARNQTKFNRLLLFGEALPQLRTQIDKDLRRHGLPRERVVAVVVRLLEETLIRIGNEEYARNNNSYGLTTLRTDHVDVTPTRLRFEFRGKSGKEHQVDIRDPRAARVVRQCQELPGQELFKYVDEEGNRHTVESADVNEYLYQATGQNFTAKDFRTWGGTVAAVRALLQLGPCESEGKIKQNLVEAVKRVARQLGNTTTVCRQYYIHPAVVDTYQQGLFFDICQTISEQSHTKEERQPEEQVVLTLLRRHLAQQTQ